MAALALVLLLGVWGLTALADSSGPGAGNGGGPAGAPGTAAHPAPHSGEPSATDSAGATPSGEPSSSAAPSDAPSGSAAAAGASESVAPSAVPSGSAAPSASAESESGDSCPDQAIGLSAQPSAAEYGPGQAREFRMVVTNIGTVACSRDLDPALQELVVLSAEGARVWSSNDCYNAGSPQVRPLAPGEQLVFGVVWSGRSSQTGCAGQRESVPAGDYQLVAKLGELSSAPTPFRLLG